MPLACERVFTGDVMQLNYRANPGKNERGGSLRLELSVASHTFSRWTPPPCRQSSRSSATIGAFPCRRDVRKPASIHTGGD
eukprot:9031408-Pyramimonas_sp.AAC.1